MSARPLSPLRTLACLAVAAAAASGCLRRIETIEVFPDGSVDMAVRLEGDPEDLRTGDPLPAETTGWQVTEKVDPDDQDNIIRTARKRFAAGAPLPDTYAPAGGPLADHALHFDTEVRVEQRPEGTYYHFRRVYRPRRYAFVDYLRKQELESDAVQNIKSKDPRKLTDEERNRFAKALIQAEEYKALAFLEDALRHVGNQIAPDAGLRAWEAVHHLFESEQLQADARKLLDAAEQDTADAGKQLAKLSEDLRADVLAAVHTGLTEAGAPPAHVARFADAFQAVRQDFEITEDLGDDVWAVGVKLPGVIIAHNVLDPETRPLDPSAAEKTAPPFDVDQMEDGFPRGPDRCGWSFEGEALYDRPVLLMATSFVAKK